jgi:hypothetical protein
MTESSPPSVAPIKLSVQYSGEKLDKLKSNYKEWCEEITIALSLNGLYEYVTGTITAPATSETRALITGRPTPVSHTHFLRPALFRPNALL